MIYNFVMGLGQKGFSIFGILFRLALLLLIYYVIVKLYFAILFDKDTRQYLRTQGINTTNIQGMIDSMKYKVEDINKALARREKETEKLFDEGGDQSR